MAQAAGKIALVAGGSGLVGGRLIPLLLAAPEYARVYVLSRRPLTLSHPRVANRVVRFDAPLGPQLKGLNCQDAFCCLGTTIRAAGSQAAFRAVDHDLVLAFARLAASVGATRLVLVSSIGANAAANNLYLRVKGETERDLEALRLPALDILQPSVLLGIRAQWRPMELGLQLLMGLVGPLLLGPVARYRAIDARTLAAAMLGAARSGRPGAHRYTYRDLLRLSKLTRPSRTVIH